ncbi:haloacid dehalogenase superfamily protein, subfamily IA, variant 3 with third motif having DD or ED [Mycolicibacterium chubuense NBB4]|uniref:Haloacid dehalogenase superfamily protein, subfamily IA, variant 3 with third motif having DD or ED n=1 Tax=Mycolicibacterium chubuense (strain NBB4) TaxID=710421 RepID=I4BCH1_MYCCN|nr:HAD-IA family hydrolase [Mycolicibacterium chubuense]AFM14978.1 haloacid dehalogenase superfamily protein, subfamily IA, variant 3 with third motif having DD or ED [Mycolicibacterium chubuense NBB4]
MPAILFGSISTIADTSELQRRAFNEAFAEHGLDWNWSRDEYRSLLTSNGGARRIADYAAERGVDVDADAVHATKSILFQRLLTESAPELRPGVGTVIEQAKAAGHRLAFVTTTSKANVDALLAALAPDVDASTFDVIVYDEHVDEPKPSPAAYRLALDWLGLDATEAVAIEDNLGGVRAARAAGLTCIAFPNTNTAGAPFDGASETTDQLDARRVLALAAA